MKTLYKLLLSVVIIVAVMIGLQLLMPWLSDNYLIYLQTGLDTLISWSVPPVIAIIVAVSLKKYGNLIVPSLKPEVRKFSPMLIVFGLILVQAAQIVVYPLADMLPTEFMAVYTQDLVRGMQSGLWPMVASIFVMPILMEWLFRGIIQRSLAHRIGVYWGIVIASLLYGMTHIMPQEMILAFASALVYGAIYFLKHSLSTVILVHILANGLSYLLFLMFGSEAAFREAIITSQTMYIVVWTVSLLLLTITAAWVSNHDNNRKIKRRKKQS